MRRRSVIIGIMLLLLCLTKGYGQNRIIVSKHDFMLYVISPKNDTIMRAPVAVAKNLGNKTRVGDYKTPEGTFSIVQIQNSSAWTHDFKDGQGQRKGAYGPYFIRLRTPVTRSIGIHGTCFPESIGTRCSEGCIRMLNSDVSRLAKLVRAGDKCTILPD